MDGLGSAKAYWKHLRLPFQLTLAPLFLWGFFLGEGRLGTAFLLGFVSLHFFLYPGITAFNSAYDRDKGPVSGMLEPPEVPAGLLRFSILLQLLGMALAAPLGAAFLAIYIVIASLAACYSHPRLRWKASPWGSALVVAVGQGGLGFLAGWSAASRLPDLSSAPALLGALGAALTVLGLYPSTQAFQIEEDAARGDRTLAVVLGPARALHLGSLCLLAGGAAGAWLIAQRSGTAETLLLGGAYAAATIHNALFAISMGKGGVSTQQAYRWAMRTNKVAAAGFLAFTTKLLLLPA